MTTETPQLPTFTEEELQVVLARKTAAETARPSKRWQLSGDELKGMINLGWRDLRHALIGQVTAPDLSGIDFTSVDFTGAKFMGVNFADADFSFAKLGDVEFEYCNMNGASFYCAHLNRVRAIRTTFYGVTFDGAELIGFWQYASRGMIQMYVPDMSSRGDWLYAVAPKRDDKKSKIMIKTGCFWGPLVRWRKAVIADHGEDALYLKTIPIIRAAFKD